VIAPAQPLTKLGDRGEVRLGVAREDHEQHVLPACRLDRTAAQDPSAVGEQHDLEQHARGIGRSPGRVVAKPRREGRKIQLVIDQVGQRVLEAAWDDLRGQIHRQQSRAHVDVLVARHFGTHPSLTMMCASSRTRGGSTRGAGGFFYSLNDVVQPQEPAGEARG